MAFYNAIEEAISRALGEPFSIRNRTPIGGGCINKAEKLSGPNGSFFLKSNQASFLPRFEEEVESLEELRETNTIRVPSPICSGVCQDKSFLILEFIEPGIPRTGSWSSLGTALAELHRKPMPFFGWRRDNAIGATRQRNESRPNWVDFYREQRLGFQIELARKNGFDLPRARALLEAIPQFFSSYDPRPSLLHGDLWSGNAAFDASGSPFVFDPCCYYGDRETDLAFSEFFGGFGTDFYTAYNREFPPDSGYSQRKTLYNLYHCLNHFNLFGSPYETQASSMAANLLAEL